MGRRVQLALGAAAALAALAGASASLLFLPSAPPGEVFVEIERGAPSRTIAARLAEQGVVRYAWQYLGVRVLRWRTRVQAGEYRFSSPATPWAVFDRLARGDVHYYELAVPEGANQFDIAAAVEKLGLIPRADFLKAAADPALIRDLDPHARNLEGYLFPATYRLTRRTTAGELCRMMTGQFRRHWKQVRATRPVRELVTLASLVEKETGIAAERPLVASVYWNRLDRAMLLQCDPTVIYAALLEGRWRGSLFKSDLASDHPFNTYRHAGLPPGPIANPGLAALQAAAQPAVTDYLYFVAKPGGSGEHTFTKAFPDHLKAVFAYRRGQKTDAAR
jgi:UPF0755 protein